MKFIFVSGGVISGLGKGITTASIALLLKSRGIKVSPIKCDAYMNVDAGTIRPQEHGEVFVTTDGMECDQDIGNYERFLGEELSKDNYVTNGQIYQEVIRKERSFEYNGEDVEIVPHIPEEMIRRFKQAGKAKNAEVVIIEIGGTVGEYQNALFIEANRIMKYRDKEEVIHVHVGYLPTPSFLGEMKSKPVQTSVRTLSSTGIQPDFIIGRAEKPIDEKRKERISWLCNIDKENIISDPDVSSIYEIPLIFQKQKLDEKILHKLALKPKNEDLKEWHKLFAQIGKLKKKVKIGLVGKYFSTGDFTLADSYISVIEAIKHAAWDQGLAPELTWIDAENFDPTSPSHFAEATRDKKFRGVKKIEELADLDGIVVPGGFGERGTEGLIRAVEFARVNKIPYLGLCYGLQMAVIEFARNVCGLKNANTIEIDPKTKYPVIDLMDEQIKTMDDKLYGGTMRLGAYPCKVQRETVAWDAYNNMKPFDPFDKLRVILRQSKDDKAQGKNLTIFERHRHRYELNNKYRDKLVTNGLVVSGTSPDNKLVEIIELNKKEHPFFLGTQFHPEFQSNPLNPHPLFIRFVAACSINERRSHLRQ